MVGAIRRQMAEDLLLSFISLELNTTVVIERGVLVVAEGLSECSPNKRKNPPVDLEKEVVQRARRGKKNKTLPLTSSTTSVPKVTKMWDVRSVEVLQYLVMHLGSDSSKFKQHIFGQLLLTHFTSEEIVSKARTLKNMSVK